MSLLFLMPEWNSTSELWMQRMIEALEPHLAAVAAFSSSVPENYEWQRRVPAVSLLDRIEIEKAAVAAQQGRRSLSDYLEEVMSMRLAEILRDPAITEILVHYLPVALRFEPVFDNSRQKLFVHCHGYDVTWDFRDSQFPLTPQFDEEYPRAVRRLSDRAIIIANSQWTARQLLSVGVPEDRIVIKPFGVPCPAKFPLRLNKEGPVEFLYLGRLVDFKGPDQVLQAFEQACQRGMNGRLTIAGEGPLRSKCETMRETSDFKDRIQLVGKVTAVEGDVLRARADVFTLHNCKGPVTRQEEAFGVSIIEAMAAGLPIVSTFSGAIPEIVTDGEMGLLVAPGDITAHANALFRLAEHDEVRFSLGRNGWSRVQKEFSMHGERASLFEILGFEISS